MMQCIACRGTLRLKFLSNLSEGDETTVSYASRKKPELLHYDYLECANCRTLVTMPDEGVSVTENYRNALHESTLESHYAASTYTRLIREHISESPASVLDVGCSDGAFLSAMADFGSKHLEGIEPSERAAGQSSDSRIIIHNKGFEEYETNRQFQLVSILQTIEHLSNPRDTLIKARDLCSPEGYLVVICHDRLSVLNRLLGTHSPIFDIEHLQIFTQNGLRLLLEGLGYRILVLRRFTNRYPLTYVLRLLGFEPRRRSIMERISMPVPAGNLLLIAQPTSHQ